MRILEDLYTSPFFWNYYAIGYLLEGLFTGAVSVLLIKTRLKSSSTKTLILFFAVTCLFSMLYALNFGSFSKWSAYHRWITFPIAGFLPVIVAYFMLVFPSNENPRFTRIFMPIWISATSLLSLFFVYGTSKAPIVFNSSAEIWDFDADEFSKKLGIGLIANAIIMMILGAFRFWQSKGNRTPFLYLILSFSLIIVIPSGLNVMMRAGLIERAIFVKWFCILCISGFFILLLTYLNHTKDPSSFMTKLVAITAASFLLLLEFLSFEALKDRTEKFQIFAQKELELLEAGKSSDRIQHWKLLDESLTGEPTKKFLFPQGKEHLPVLEIRTQVSRGEFQYAEYRKEIHEASLPLVKVIFSAALLILVFFPAFFYKSLVQPLNRLLSGVRSVNEGNYETQIQATVEDEIGFLTKSFNSMVANVRSARLRLQEYANELEDKVEERTKDLRLSLEKVQELKNQQDGDYFLTSLLLKPLSENKADSSNVVVEFLTSQKKKFQFKDWQEEIGGDINMANSILLKGKKYTVFINADAMGKSLQGAGGALVLGSVFESILNRNKVSSQAQDHSPERWIKNTFLELNQVFETFDGSMLVSMVLGLVDDTTGLLYAINVEHPWMILYRKGKAEFLHTQKTYRKLGTLGADGNIQIFTYLMQAGDCLLAGSDGRDDILLPNPKGEAQVNEDENLILENIQSNGADLQKIQEQLLSMGKLIDDLSFVKIQYLPKQNPRDSNRSKDEELYLETKKIFKKNGHSKAISFAEEQLEDGFLPRLAKFTFQMALKAKDYKKASKYLTDLLVAFPENTELLFRASFIQKKLWNYQEAIDLGERVKLRDPKHTKNLINLADAYYLEGNVKRSIYLIDMVLKIDANNSHAKQRLRVFETGI